MNTQSTSGKLLISIVVPVYNEEANVVPSYDAISHVADSLSSDYDFEFVYTDNHSTDNTFALLRTLVDRDPRVRAFRFSKNFGYQRSIMTGYAKCRGAAAIQMDCDLQDPPEMIATFLTTWRHGADVVYGIRATRKEGKALTMARGTFYRLINFLSEEELPVDSGDFRLVSRRVIDLLTTINDPTPYLRGMIASMGFKQIGIRYDRRARERGESKFPLSKLIALAIDGILNHSTVPLRISTYFGLTISVVTLLLMVCYAAAKIFLHSNWPAGFTTLATLALASMSVNAMLLGILGEYLGRIYRQVRREPFTIIEQEVESTTAKDLASQIMSAH